MADRMDLAENANRRRKLRDCAFLLPFAGMILLVPPMIHIFATSATVFGVPLIIAYLTAVWLGLILLARVLAGALMRMHEPAEQTE